MAEQLVCRLLGHGDYQKQHLNNVPIMKSLEMVTESIGLILMKTSALKECYMVFPLQYGKLIKKLPDNLLHADQNLIQRAKTQGGKALNIKNNKIVFMPSYD